VTLQVDKTACEWPINSEDEKRCLATYVNVGGHEAWTLWDLGSTTSGITPVFTQVADIPMFPLTNPHILQLGAIGSWSTINYSTKTRVKAPGADKIVYLDIANFDHYDMIIGTLYMRQNGVLLDFLNNQVIVNGVATPATPIELLDTDGCLHWYRTTDKWQNWPHGPCKKAMIEDVPDEEVQQVGKTLPEGANTLLVMEDEYKNTHQRGEESPPTWQKHDQKTAMNKPAIQQTNQNKPPGSKPKAHPITNSVMVEKPLQKCNNTGYNIQECQPTSSKVNMEDPVTREQEQILLKEQQWTEEIVISPTTTQHLWDKPVQDPQYNWAYDPHMPWESGPSVDLTHYGWSILWWL